VSYVEVDLGEGLWCTKRGRNDASSDYMAVHFVHSAAKVLEVNRI